MTEKNILVVDDDKIILDILEGVFSRFGYAVRTAENAERALEILKEEEIRVMFLDINMPRMNGLELCQKIRKKYPRSIIYALTGNGSLLNLFEYRQAGFDDFFRKPMDLGALCRAAEDGFLKIEMREYEKAILNEKGLI